MVLLNEDTRRALGKDVGPATPVAGQLDRHVGGIEGIDEGTTGPMSTRRLMHHGVGRTASASDHRPEWRGDLAVGYVALQGRSRDRCCYA